MNSLTVTNRDLLRNFKAYKKKLLSNEIESILVPEDNYEIEIKIKALKPKITMEELCEKLRKKNKNKKNKIENIKRTNIFSWENVFKNLPR